MSCIRRLRFPYVLMCGAVLAIVAAPVLAEQSAVDRFLERAIELSDRTERARQAYHDAHDDQDRERRRREYEDSERRYQDAKKNLDRERIRTIADAADVRPRKVRRMRENGMGWGKIAKELDVHPSVLGKGHNKKGAHKKHHHDHDDDDHHYKKQRYDHDDRHYDRRDRDDDDQGRKKKRQHKKVRDH